MESCLRSDSQRTTRTRNDDRRSRSVKIASPIVWQSKDETKLRKKRQFIEKLSFAQIKVIMRDYGLAIDDGEEAYESCVHRLMLSRWIPPRDAIRSYQRMRSKPVRTLSQKREDRVRLCTLATVGNLSIDEMKLWLTRNGDAIPDGEGEANRKDMARLIRNRMRVTTPCFRQKQPPKRPKKGKKASFIIRRKPAVPAPVLAANSNVVARKLQLMAPAQNHHSDATKFGCEAKEPETPLTMFVQPQTPLTNGFVTPITAQSDRACPRSALQTPCAALFTVHESTRKASHECGSHKALRSTNQHETPNIITPIQMRMQTPMPCKLSCARRQSLESPMMNLLETAGFEECKDEEETDHIQQNRRMSGGFLGALEWD